MNGEERGSGGGGGRGRKGRRRGEREDRGERLQKGILGIKIRFPASQIITRKTTNYIIL